MILTGVKGNLLQLDSKGVRPPLERLKWEGVEGVVDCRRIVKGASGCTSCAVLWPDSWGPEEGWGLESSDSLVLREEAEGPREKGTEDSWEKGLGA